MSNEKKVVETVKIAVEVDGATVGTIDLGLVTQGEKKGEARSRLSGADVVKFLLAYEKDGASGDEVVAALKACSKLSGATADGPRDEQFDEIFTSVFNGMRTKGTNFTKLRSDFAAIMAVKVAEAKAWGVAEAMANHQAVKEAFSGYLYADPAAILAKPVLEQRGKQQVSLKPLAAE